MQKYKLEKMQSGVSVQRVYQHKLKDRLIVPFECFDEQGVVLEIR